MDELIECLNIGEDAQVKLFFISRRRNQATRELLYDVLASRIRPEVAHDLKTNAINQIHGIQSRDHEVIEYGILLQSDRRLVETIDYRCVPFLVGILEKIAQPVDGNLISDDDYPHVWGYVVRVELINKTVFLFRKYTPKKLLEKDKLACVIDRHGQFAKLSDQAIALDSHYDAALLLESREQNAPDEPSLVYIFNHGSFESLFSFVEEYRQEIEGNQKQLGNMEILEDISQLIETCIADTRALRKLAKILVTRSYSSLTSDKIRETVHDYNLSVTLNTDGKIMVTGENIWEILRILNDDYGESKATGNKYEMRAKVRK